MTSQEQRLKAQKIQDQIFRGSTRFFAFLVLVLLLGIIGSLIWGAMPALKAFGFGFLFSGDWNPVTEQFGGLNSITGTLLSSFIALLIGVPVSFGIAIFLTELSPVWLRRPLGMAIELLAGVPSIIYGMWGLFIFAPWFADNIQPKLTSWTEGIPLLGSLFQGPPMGIGMFSAGLILSIMVIPFIASVMRDVFEVVPPMLKESAYGLGCTTWEVVWNVVLPYTKNGVIGGVMLGLGRALGETMAVTFVIGNAQRSIESLFDPATSIAATLANEFTEATGELHTGALIELGLLLFVITFIVLSLSKLLLLRLQRNEGANA
ncbi:phosphate ABC transporter permease subunit PstC [Chitiniphilus eburneus]|uniref:Phosphate transport system permease protein n=1 Tax=Chitiniphilus eburneus TaxID=2571148 RepID=A0A4U0Q3J2_9NEIS|nr:phosphate ABC transporter permease subunit PstC [Chitiniphilus eburneus]TJZ75647.1 phosphate ABC transporter permease subunit PstC [Chitiniphilus eburneus]